MTPNLREASGAWADYIHRVKGLTKQESDLLAAIKAEPADSQPLTDSGDGAIKVGDGVSGEHHPSQKGKVLKVEPPSTETRVYVRWSNWNTNWCDASDLTKLPPELPSDHLSRFWIPGAWLVHKTLWESETTVVIDDEMAIQFWTRDDTRAFGVGQDSWRRNSRTQTGWSFHPQSPIQETREP